MLKPIDAVLQYPGIPLREEPVSVGTAGTTTNLGIIFTSSLSYLHHRPIQRRPSSVSAKTHELALSTSTCDLNTCLRLEGANFYLHTEGRQVLTKAALAFVIPARTGDDWICCRPYDAGTDPFKVSNQVDVLMGNQMLESADVSIRGGAQTEIGTVDMAMVFDELVTLHVPGTNPFPMLTPAIHFDSSTNRISQKPNLTDKPVRWSDRICISERQLLRSDAEQFLGSRRSVPTHIPKRDLKRCDIYRANQPAGVV